MRLVAPLRERSFRRLAGGKLGSHLADWLLLAALVGWVYQDTRSTAAVAGLMLLRLAPPIVGGGLAASLVDRLPKGRLLVRLELLRCVGIALALAGVLSTSRALVFGATALVGLVAPLTRVSVRALVPALVPGERLPAANAVLAIAEEAATGLGALAGGVAVAIAGPGVAAVAALGAAAGAAASYAGVPAPLRGPRPGRRGVRAGLGYLRGRPAVFLVVVSFGVATLATGLTNATLPRLLDGSLGLGAGGYGFGLAALAGGLALGEAAVGRLRAERIGPRGIGYSLAGMAIVFAALAFSSTPAAALVSLALIGVADGTSEVVFDTVVQREVEECHLGSVFGFAQTLMTTTMMGAVALAPVVNRVAAPRTAILLAAACAAAAGVVAFAATRRRAPGSVVLSGA